MTRVRKSLSMPRVPPSLFSTAATGGSGGNALKISTTVAGATASGSTLAEEILFSSAV